MPLVELCVLVGLVLLVWGLLRLDDDGGRILLVCGMALASIGGLETALRERRDLHELREPGIAACPRCQTLHDTDANFCPGCGTALRGAAIRDAAPVTVAPVEQPPPQREQGAPS